MQDFEETEKTEMSNDTAINDRISDHFFEKKSSQESQHSRKSSVTTSLNTSGREKKAKKFNCKNGIRVRLFRENLHRALTHH